MGLDQYIYRVKKPNLEDKVYTYNEISETGLGMASAIDFETNTSLFEQLIPYAVKRNLVCQLYNVEKMIEDYNLPKDAHIWCWSGDYIEIGCYKEDGIRVNQRIMDDEIETKYTKTEVIPYYIWEEDEEYYWRKNYDLQDWIRNVIEGVDNTGYYILNADLIAEINEAFNSNISEEDPTEESAVFYWEWY